MSSDNLVEAEDEGELSVDKPLATVTLEKFDRSLFELHRWYALPCTNYRRSIRGAYRLRELPSGTIWTSAKEER
jgi:hypothetical protein